MVQTDIAQLSTECSEWRQTLRNYRDEFAENKKHLQDIFLQPLSKNHLQEVEHFQNQLHIQLINIHDLKQSIKAHERRLEAADAADNVFMKHEHLLEEFTGLENTLQELSSEFKNFIRALGH